MRLTDYFSSVAAKRLSAVEINERTSNQHEFNGVRSLKQTFGSTKSEYDAHFVYLAETEDDTVISPGKLTWYDSRAKQTHRTAEFRLYYNTGNTVVGAAREGDLLIVARSAAEQTVLIIARDGSTADRQLCWLFGLSDLGTKFSYASVDESEKSEVGALILRQIGIEPRAEDNEIQSLIRKFGKQFPDTKTFSTYARSICKDIDAVRRPDDALLAWWSKEDALFRLFEAYLVGERLRHGFMKEQRPPKVKSATKRSWSGEFHVPDVESFIGYSLSVHNRRKSRAGSALENHVEELFLRNRLAFSRTAVTELKAKPDFVLPGIGAYRQAKANAPWLTVLGVKTTCKDRWRQVLSEALKVRRKHLLTLEPGISEDQTTEMDANHLTLVIPETLHESYSQKQRNSLLTVRNFLSLAQQRQSVFERSR